MPTSIFPQWLHDLNLVLGVIGFAITVIVMWQVSAIKRSFRSRARLPEVIRDLEKAGSGLSVTLENWPNKRHLARSHIKVVASLLEASMHLVPNPTRKLTANVQKKLSVAARQFDENEFDDPSQVWDLYSDIQSAIASMSQITQNLKWA